MAYQSAIPRTTLTDTDGEYLRHWSPESELYAPADVLFQYLRLGWKLNQLVAVEVVYYGGYRRSVIYYFTLENGDKGIEMPVIATPPAMRLIEEQGLITLYAWSGQPTFNRSPVRRRYPWHKRVDLADRCQHR